MLTIKKLLPTVIGENVRILRVGEKPHWILFDDILSWDDYKLLVNCNPKWLKFEVTHLVPRDNVLCVEVKNNSF